MTSRPLVHVRGTDAAATVPLPEVLTAPIRTDIVQFVHTNMNKNARQAYARATNAGEQTSAESWGTGRAVSRIPRVGGSGTHRSGQGAFGNMCRGGRQFAPSKVWRRWHRPINVKQRRFAVCSALAASAVAPLVMARGHAVDNIPEVPLVVADSAFGSVTKTSEAVALLKELGADADVRRVKESRSLRAGAGKMRNRRYVQRKGPLIVHAEGTNKNSSLFKTFRNIPGVDVAPVSSLNLLELAPGGHVGRFIIWTRSAFESLDSVYGNSKTVSKAKNGYRPPVAILANADLSAVVNSAEIQSALKAKKDAPARTQPKRNAIKSASALTKLNPYAASLRRRAILAQKKSASDRKAAQAVSRSTKKTPRSTKFVKDVLFGDA